jgi:hypothetical protein
MKEIKKGRLAMMGIIRFDELKRAWIFEEINRALNRFILDTT